MKLKALLTVLCISLLLAAAAEEISTQVSPQYLTEGDTGELRLVTDSDSGISVRDLPKVDGLEWSGGISRQSSVSYINGRQTASFLISFPFTAMRAGSVTIPAFSVKTKNGMRKTNPVSFTVRAQTRIKEAKDGSGQPAFGILTIPDRSDGSKRMKYYVGEDIPLLFFIYVRTRYSPEAVGSFMLAPDPKGAAELTGAPVQQNARQTVLDGNAFRQIPFLFTIRALMPGPLAVRMSLPLALFSGDGFFSRQAGRKTVSGNLDGLEILPLPELPPDTLFSGLIGSGWNVQYQLSPGPCRMGEPMTLQITVAGDGDINRLEFLAPKLDDFRTYPPEIRRNVKGKIARISLTLLPLREGDVPFRIPFTVFDTRTGKYETTVFEKTLKVEAAAKSAAAGAAVAAGPGASLPVPDAETAPRSQQILYLHESDDAPPVLPLWKNALFPSLLLIAAGLAVLCVCTALRIRRRILAADPAARRRAAARGNRRALLRKLREMREDGLPDETAAELGEYLNALLDLPPGTSLSETARNLRTRSPELAEMLDRLSASAWAPKGSGSSFDNAFRTRLVRAVGRFAVLLFACGSAVLSASGISSDLKAAYDSGDFKKAQSLCAGRPGASALYNSGNCRYHLGDIPGALADYERAAKLAPRDTDIRENLNVARRKLGLREKYQLNAPGDLPVFLRDLLRIDEWITAAAAGLMLCLSGVGLSMLYGRRVLIVLCTAGAVFILVAGSAAFWQYHAENSGEALVLKPDTTVYTLPSDISGKVVSKLKAGTEIRICERQPEWSRIRFSGGEGWVKAGSVRTVWPEPE